MNKSPKWLALVVGALLVTMSAGAEIDFDAKAKDMEDLLHSGALTRGDLIDTIKAQQYEINSLKKENKAERQGQQTLFDRPRESGLGQLAGVFRSISDAGDDDYLSPGGYG